MSHRFRHQTRVPAACQEQQRVNTMASEDTPRFKTESFDDDLQAIASSLNEGDKDAKRAMCLQSARASEAEKYRVDMRDFCKGKQHLEAIYTVCKKRPLFLTRLRTKGLEMTDNMFT